jgi:transposase
MMHGAHIGGQRAGAFLDLVRGVDPERVLLVGIDVAKATWFVVASNLLGEVVVDGVRLVADRAGLAELERVLGAASARVNAAMVVVGIEAAGHQHQTLTAHLLDRDELVVRVLNPAQVAAVRKQQGNRRRKTDWLDAAAICELLARGEGALVHLDGSAASALRPLWSGRKDLVDSRSRLRQQAGALVDCLWPGCSAKDTVAGVTPVLCDLFATKAGRVLLELLAQGWTPARVAATSVAGLRGLFAVRGCRLTRPLATRLIGRAQAALPAHPAATAGKAATLAALLGTIDTLDREIACLEAAMAPLLARTQGAKLTQLRGVGVVAAAGFVAFVGSTDRWAEWSKVWRAAGLDPARSQSGPADARLGISREGSAWGRRAILDLAAAVCQQPGPGATICAPAPPSSTNPPRSPSRPPPTPSGAPCLRSWPRAPTLILASKPNAPQRGRQVVKQPEPDDISASEGPIRRRSQAMRPDLALSLAPAPRTFLQTADVASCGQTAHAIPSACGREDTQGLPQSQPLTVTISAAPMRPNPTRPRAGLDRCYGELS